jgi:hypothetical protein
MKITGLLLGVIMAFLIGCSSHQVKEYQNEKPNLVLEDYFNGELTAHGVFTDRSGRVKKRFIVDMVATWKEGVGTLDESFRYSDGTTSKRVWTLKKVTDNQYVGTAPDVVGEAKGEVSGNAFYFNYVLALDVDGTIYHVTFDDWMFLMDDKVMINRSYMKKFGFKLGEVTLSFSKK